MKGRHPILYDLVRWQRNRTLLIGSTVVCYAIALGGLLLRPNDPTWELWVLVGSALLSIGLTLWMRARLADVRVGGDQIVVRVAGGRQRVPIEAVRRVRVARLGAVFSGRDRGRLLPRSSARGATPWAEREAVVVRLGDGFDLTRLRRVAGRRAVVDHDLVLCVADPHGLAAEIQSTRPVAAAAPPAARRRRRR